MFGRRTLGTRRPAGENPRVTVATTFELVGRQDELARLEGFVGDLSAGAAGVVIRGEAGIGKTVLWRAALDLAETAGVRVLVTRCAETEMPLALGGVGDLIETALAEVAEELAEPQRKALAVVVGLEAPRDEAPDPTALPRAFLACLRTLASRSPVLVAVDDVQWLDAPSQRMLGFAARRLGDAAIGILVTQRGDVGDPLDLSHAFDGRVAEIRVGPLSVGALNHLIRTRLDVRIPRPTLARVHRASGGNPMFALEFAQVAASAGGPLPLPSSLEELVRDRVAALPPAIRSLLGAVAAAERPTPTVLARAVEGEFALDEAIAAGAVALAPDGIVRFTHPLLASAVYDAIPPGRRAVVHTRLANTSSDIEERARNLALAAGEPDVKVARLLDEAAAHARARGAPDAAAVLAEQAVRLTPLSDGEARENRMLAAAEFLVDFDVVGATRVLDELLGAGVSGRRRARALVLRYQVEHDAEPAGRLAQEALEHVEGDRALRARVLLLLSAHAEALDDPTTSATLARRALAEAERLDEKPVVLGAALGATAWRAAVAGDPEPALADRALALAAEHRSVRGAAPIFLTNFVANDRVLGGKLAEARVLLEENLDEAVRGGREGMRWHILTWGLVPLELETGNWAVAERHFQAADDLASDADSPWGDVIMPSLSGLIATLRGRVVDARRLLAEGIRCAESFHVPSLVATDRAVLGFLELSLGEPAAAWRTLSEAPAAVERRFPTYPGFPEPMPNAVEALVALGRLDDADTLLGRFDARWPDHSWALPARLRCRALLLLARRDLEAALHEAEEAVVASAAVGFPLDRGRGLLVAGDALRRLGQRRRAAEKLDAAKQVFVELGAPLWVARAEKELRRARPRPRRERELTSAERGVAALVAAGRTNREVAAELFTTVGTVEVHLTRIYRKLGLRSRTELARQVAEGTLDIDDE
jgi:DNA-binding CsgD family transcriptional regulator